MQGFKTDLF